MRHPRTGTNLIRSERLRQLRKGYGSGWDDHYTSDELARAAACYLDPEAEAHGLIRWPWKPESFKPAPTDQPSTVGGRIRELVKAGALIAAEIDRLGRL